MHLALSFSQDVCRIFELCCWVCELFSNSVATIWTCLVSLGQDHWVYHSVTVGQPRSTSWRKEFGVTIGPLLLKCRGDCCHPDSYREDMICPGLDLNLNVIHGIDWAIKITSVKQLFFTKSLKNQCSRLFLNRKKIFWGAEFISQPYLTEKMLSLLVKYREWSCQFSRRTVMLKQQQLWCCCCNNKATYDMI